MATVAFRNLVKRYAVADVVKGIDLDIADGEFVVLVGPSGCGKSTSLRMLAGLEDISAGEILIGGRVVNEVDARDRDIAMVFQDYALYPHMTVYENMAFSLRYRGAPKREIRGRVGEVAEILGLSPLLERRPKELSGGQRQRVAMGRAIVRQPQVFLFDEPLSNLDAQLRGSVRLEIKRLHRRLGITTVYVTHDQVEAMTLADRVVVMNAGTIEQVGTPDEVYHTPRTLFVAGFIGSPTMNLMPAAARGEGRLALGDGSTTLHWPRALPSGPLQFGIRPEDVSLPDGALRAGQAEIEAVVDVVEPLGADTLVFVHLAGHSVVARLRPQARPALGEVLTLRLDLTRAHLFDALSTRAIA